jgi:hypothetical protein
MGTAGVAIGSVQMEADAITVAAVRWPVAAVMRAAVADRTQRQHITMAAASFTATHRLPMMEGRVPVNPMQQRHTQTAADRTRLQRIVAVVVVVDSKVVVDMPAAVVEVMLAVAVVDMKAADTNNW